MIAGLGEREYSRMTVSAQGETSDVEPRTSQFAAGGAPWAAAMIRWRWLLFAAAVGLALLAGVDSRRLEFDRSIDNMFSPADPVLVDFHRFRDVFAGDQIILVVYEDDKLLADDGAGLRRSADVTAQLRRVPGVSAALSLAVVEQLLQGMGTSLLARDEPLARQYRQMFEGYTHGADERVASIACILDEDLIARQGVRPTVEGMRAIAGRLPSGVLVGEPVMVNDSFQYVEEDARRLSWMSTILLGATLLILLRSLRWALTALAVVHWTLLVTQSVLVWSELRLSMVSSMLTAVVTVIGVATVMHLALGYQDRCRRGILPRTALGHTLSLLSAPIVWACITDAVGFGALLAAQAGPVRDFGLMMALGSLLVLVAVALLVPAMTLAGSGPASQVQPRGARRLERGLMSLIAGTRRRGGVVTVSVVVLVGLAVAGSARLEVETDFTRNFRSSSAIARAYSFVENRLGGAGAWDIMLPAPRILNQTYIDRVLRLQEQLRALREPGTDRPALANVLSMADTLDAGRLRTVLAAMPIEVRARGMQAVMPQFVGALRGRSPDSSAASFRVMLRAYDQRDARTKLWLIQEVERLAREAFPAGPRDEPTRVTGFYVLLTHLVAGMLRDQWRCFLVATIGVGIVMAMAVRTLRGACAALITNTLPIFMALGAVGWCGLKLNMGAAMMAAVSMGLSVDSSLHYLYAFARARRAGSGVELALAEAQQTVGRALVLATLALALGFATLCLSDFVPTVYFGGLAAATLVGGLLGNLIVLPLLVAWLEPRRECEHAAASGEGREEVLAGRGVSNLDSKDRI